MKVIYYYQTFVGLDKLLTHREDVDVIIVSSIHFGKNKDNQLGIYLNDNKPDDKLFDELWFQTEKLSNEGCTIMLMMGGAGGAYQELFSDFETYYGLLVDMIKKRPWIKGIDLDVEEEIKYEDIKMLIKRIVEDFGEDFIITMAPIAPSLIYDCGSLAGFNYKSLYKSEVGKYIHWFNAQSYYSFSKKTYDSIIKNGYPPKMIVMGMESGQFDDKTFQGALENVKQIKQEYPDMGGVFDWEYLDAPPNSKDPSEWSKLMKQC